MSSSQILLRPRSGNHLPLAEAVAKPQTPHERLNLGRALSR